MKVGAIPEVGVKPELNRWYWGIEIFKCPPYQTSIFRPFLTIWFVKWLDFGEPYKLNGRPEIKRGGHKRWTSPLGIEIRFTRF